GLRSATKRPVNSAAMCWLSAAEPPLPQIRSFCPPERAVVMRRAARSMAGEKSPKRSNRSRCSRSASGRTLIIAFSKPGGSPARSIRSAASQHDARGLEQYIEVEEQVSLPDIINVERDTSPIVGIVTSGHLPQPRDTWLDRKINGQRSSVSHELFAHDRSRPDQAHFTAQ